MLFEIFSSIISYEMPILKSVSGCATLRTFCAKMTEDFTWDVLEIQFLDLFRYIFCKGTNKTTMAV